MLRRAGRSLSSLRLAALVPLVSLPACRDRTGNAAKCFGEYNQNADRNTADAQQNSLPSHMLLVILDLVRPDGQGCLKKKASDVNDGLFGQMWISHPKGIKYSWMVRRLRYPRGCVQVLSPNAHSGKTQARARSAACRCQEELGFQFSPIYRGEISGRSLNHHSKSSHTTFPKTREPRFQFERSNAKLMPIKSQ